MELDVHVQYTITNGGSAAVGPLFQTLARIIKRLEVIVGGRDTVWSVSGAALAALLEYQNSEPVDGMDDTVVLTGSAATVYNIHIPVQLYLPNGRRPDDTGLDLRRVSQANLAITWGAADGSDQYTTPNSAAISAVTCDVEAQYLLTDNVDAAYLVRALDTVERAITGTTDNFDLIMDRGSGLFYRNFMLIGTDADIGDADAINDIRLESGTTVFHHSTDTQVIARNRNHLKLDSVITGCYYIDLTFLGQGTTMINTGLLQADLKFILDVVVGAGTTKVLAVREAVRPLKLA
jgi:hypothetical protein